jgi:hypothetical protein
LSRPNFLNWKRRQRSGSRSKCISPDHTPLLNS